MYGMRVWYKNGKIETFYCEDEEARSKKAAYYRSLNRVQKVTYFDFEDDSSVKTLFSID